MKTIRRRRRGTGVILLTMVLLMALISLIAISSMRMAMLQSRASDSFGNHVQALQAAEIAIRYCEDLVQASIAATLLTGSPAPPIATSSLLDPLSDIRRWAPGAPGSVAIPFAEHGLSVAPQCVMDESPTQYVVTARGFSANYVRGPVSATPGSLPVPGKGPTGAAAKPGQFDGAEVWLQSVTMKPAATKTSGAISLKHSWRQIVTYPS